MGIGPYPGIFEELYETAKGTPMSTLKEPGIRLKIFSVARMRLLGAYITSGPPKRTTLKMILSWAVGL